MRMPFLDGNPYQIIPCLSNSRLCIVINLLFTALPSVFPLYPCRANAMHFLLAFSPSAYEPCLLSTGHTSLSVSYKVHLKRHLLLELSASLWDSMRFGTYSRPRSASVVLLWGRFSRGSVNLALSEFPCQIWGSWGTGTNSYGSFSFSWLLRSLCAELSNKFIELPSLEEFEALRFL